MELIFQETPNRNQCAAEFLLNDLVMQCTFSTNNTVTIPKGLSYAGGNLEKTENALPVTISICPNHQARLKNAFAEITKLEN
jgi:hypothetical protein